MNRILVTGATGTIGRRLLHRLVAAGRRPVVLVREHGRGGPFADAAQVSPVVGDFSDPASLDRAMVGIDRVFLVSPNTPAQVDQEIAVIDAAGRAGVSRIVKVSAHGADPDSPVAFWRWHAAIEEHLAASEVPSVSLRPTFSMANILGHADGVRSHGVVFAPEVFAPIAMIDPLDVAEVAAYALTTDQELRPVQELSGPTGVTFDELAATIGQLTGRAVHYRAGDPAEVAAYLGSNGTPPFVTEQILAIFAALRAGNQSQPLPTVRELLGREPGTLAAFLAQHAGVFRAAS